MRKTLREKGLSSKVLYLETQREYTAVIGEQAENARRRRQAHAAIAEVTSRLAELETRLRNDALAEMGALTVELAQVDEAKAKLEDRLARLEVHAPVRGIVKGLGVNTVGGVIAPGQAILEIVPVEAELVVESRLSTRDIGHVEVGQPVTVKITTYDFGRYGSIPGRLQSISASTFEEEGEEPYYKAVIALERNHVGADPLRNLVLAGMTVQADITIGEKTLLSYLLKPVYKSVSEAFRER